MKVILISGKAQHGKDTTASMMKQYLEENYNRRVLITHYADLLKYICKAFFDWNGEKDEKGRTLLQFIGTEVIRNANQDFWVDFLTDIGKMFSDYWDYMIIPDVRFPNEISCWKINSFKTMHIRVIRDDYESMLTDSQNSHVSETALDEIKPDFYIHNDGTLDDLNAKIINFTKENIVIWRTKQNLRNPVTSI